MYTVTMKIDHVDMKKDSCVDSDVVICCDFISVIGANVCFALCNSASSVLWRSGL